MSAATSYAVTPSALAALSGSAVTFTVTPVGGVPSVASYSSAGVTSPATAGTYVSAGTFNGQPYYIISSTNWVLWYAGGAWTISSALNIPGSGYFSINGTSPIGTYTHQGTATGSPVVTLAMIPAEDLIAIAATITGSPAPVVITSLVMAPDGSAPTISIQTARNFTGTIAITLGTAGNSTTLGLPITGATFTFTIAGATGLIITQASLLSFLGPTDLAILSQQNPSATTPNSSLIQSAINAAEARIFGRLLIPQATPGITFIKYPFTVGGIALLSATGSLSLAALQLIGHEYATFILNRWRAVLSVPEDASTQGIAKMCAGFDTDGDKRIKEIIRWIWGYSEEATFLDLDLNAGATIGAPCTTMRTPTVARQTVNPDGTPRMRVSELPLFGWPAYGYVQPFAWNGYW